MSRRRAPSALRTPISRVRSSTDISMMFMITMPPTTRATATRPGPATSSTFLIVFQASSTSLAVSMSKSFSSPGRRRWRVRKISSTED